MKNRNFTEHGTRQSLTSKENVKRVFNRLEPEWIPTRSDFFFFSPRVLPDNCARVLINEAQTVRVDEKKDGADMFGIEWTYVPEVMGAITKPGNPLLSDISEWRTKLVWPDVTNWPWEESGAINKKLLEENSEKLISVTILNGLFERLITFLDFENACMALVDEEVKEDVHALFDRLCALYEEMILQLKKHFDFDMIEFHDDWGAQRSPFFSLSVCREMLVPYLKRLASFCRDHNILFQLHSCGCVGPLADAIVEAGVDMWIPQYNANHLSEIQSAYGDKFITAARRMLQPEMSPDEAIHAIDLFYELYAADLPQKPVLFFDDFPTAEAKVYFYQKYTPLGQAGTF